MKRALLTSIFGVLAVSSAVGCGGSDGAQGPAGPAGANGTDGKDGNANPSVSAIEPSQAFLSRTIDVTVSGNGTSWDDSTKVDFGDKITVNNVHAASPTALHANITIDGAAALDYRDVTVTDAQGAKETYKGAFKVSSPIAVTVNPAAGVPQGGFALVHVQMLDTSTPFDANTLAAAFQPAALALAAQPTVTDFSADLVVQADVLGTTGDVGLTVVSGASGSEIESPNPKAFKIAQRTATAISSAADANFSFTTPLDSGLYSFTPASSSLTFVQFQPSSADGSPLVSIVPKSGKLSDSLGFIATIGGFSVNSTDPYYGILIDSTLIGNIFANPPPYDATLHMTSVAVTGASESDGEAAASNNTYLLANTVATLPGLVTNGDLQNGGATDDDWYKFTVTGAPKTIHVATGGTDFATDSALEVFDVDGMTSLGASGDGDYQEDFSVDVSANGTYFVKVSASTGGYYDTAHSKYELLVETK